MLKWQDALTVVSVLLAIAAFSTEIESVVQVLISLSLAVLCISMFGHREWNILLRVTIMVIAVVAAFMTTSHIHQSNQDKEFAAYGGILYPLSLRKTMSQCGGNYKDGLFVRLGGMDLQSGQTPYTAFDISGKPLEFAKNGDDNSIEIIHLDLYDEDRTNIVNFTRGRYWISPLVRKERPNIGTLQIYDKEGRLALSVTYVSLNEIDITGIFRNDQGIIKLIAGNQSVNIGGNSFVTGCLLGGKAALKIQ